uniref:mechanosensitive ion channel family protein n=1 Tax=Candidatus Profftella armatura (Diaphorina cf. continua) TaxID=2661583 RepID=UPI0019158958|nr:mechanosensitive ion channel family protein [Candidatus Profftella armatura (Diaphorina cf. continua)]
MKTIISIAIIVIGGKFINGLTILIKRTLNLRYLNETLTNYSISTIHVVLRILLVMMVLEIFNIPIASFATLIGAAGVAVSVVWSGLLSNFASGMFLVILRPFKIGDYINASGYAGVVRDIGLFMTILTTDNNLQVYVGNNKLFTDVIVNYNVNNYRRIDQNYQITNSIDPREAINILTKRILCIENILSIPKPSVSIVKFTEFGVLLGIRLFALTSNFYQVKNDANIIIATTARDFNWLPPAAVYKKYFYTT